ncbi:hypothetical protein C0J52_01879, partial [Blattella germanica]
EANPILERLNRRGSSISQSSLSSNSYTSLVLSLIIAGAVTPTLLSSSLDTTPLTYLPPTGRECFRKPPIAEVERLDLSKIVKWRKKKLQSSMATRYNTTNLTRPTLNRNYIKLFSYPKCKEYDSVKTSLQSAFHMTFVKVVKMSNPTFINISWNWIHQKTGFRNSTQKFSKKVSYNVYPGI